MVVFKTEEEFRDSPFLPFSKKSLGRRVFFLWECLIALDPPQPPLKRGAFRLNMMCKNIYLDPPQPPLKKGG